MATLAEEIAEHVVSGDFDRLSAAAVDEATTLIRDYVGVTLGGARTTPARIVADYQRRYGSTPAEATILGSADRVSVPAAAFANAVAAHSLELDDVDQHSFLHFSSPVVSAALAVAEHVDASGQDFVAAVVAGCEVMQAISDGVNPGLRDRGFHGTSVCGVFGATAAVGRLLGLSVPELTSALGIAGGHAAGTMEIYGPTMQKRVHPGPAAQNGIVSCRLSALGFEGAPTIFDGDFGVFHAYTMTADPELTRQCLAVGAPIGVEYKPYACFRPIHTAVDCALALRAGLSGELDHVCSMTLSRHPMWADYHQAPAPRTPHEAQGSINHAIAVALVEGQALVEQFDVDRISDPTVARLSRLLEVTVDPILPRGDSCRLHIVLDDGRSFDAGVDYPKGSAGNPMSLAEHEAKFAALVAGTLSGDDTRSALDLLAALDKAPSARALVSRLRPRDAL